MLNLKTLFSMTASLRMYLKHPAKTMSVVSLATIPTIPVPCAIMKHKVEPVLLNMLELMVDTASLSPVLSMMIASTVT